MFNTQGPANPFRRPPATSGQMGDKATGGIGTPYRVSKGPSLGRAGTQRVDNAVKKAAKERVLRTGHAGTHKNLEAVAGGGGIGLRPMRATFGPIRDGNIVRRAK